MKFRKKIVKIILSSKIAKLSISYILYLYIKLVYNTTKWEIIKPDNLDIDSYRNKSVIYAFWHGRLVMMPYLCPKYSKMNILSSAHKDGELMSFVTKYFGFKTIYGTSKDKPIAAVKKILKKLRSGENIAITPDASRRGPRMRINSNIIDIARISGSHIIPISFSVDRSKIFNNWDRFILPLPFANGILIYGNPLFIPNEIGEIDKSNYSKILEEELNSISKNADEKLCLSPIMPE